jgi:hypothetical protein
MVSKGFLLNQQQDNDYYFNDFKDWLKEMKSKGVESIGNNGTWNTFWAKGVVVFDKQFDGAVINQTTCRQNAPSDIHPVYDAPSDSSYFTIYFSSGFLLVCLSDNKI